MKNKVFNIIALSCHALLLALGLGFSVYCFVSFVVLRGTSTEGADMSTSLSIGLGAVVMLLLGFFAIIYTIVALAPFIIKLIRITKSKPGLDIVCIIFSGILALANALAMFTDADFAFLIVLGGTLLITLAALTFNILSVALPERKA